jgi:hypothetical protein
MDGLCPVWWTEAWNVANTPRTALEPDEILPVTDHLAVFRTKCGTHEEKVAGQIVARTREDQFDLICAASAAVWTDTHIRLTRA